MSISESLHVFPLSRWLFAWLVHAHLSSFSSNIMFLQRFCRLCLFYFSFPFVFLSFPGYYFYSIPFISFITLRKSVNALFISLFLVYLLFHIGMMYLPGLQLYPQHLNTTWHTVGPYIVFINEQLHTWINHWMNGN